ncbi:lysozyme c-1-like [Amblyomma americanum]
MRIHLSLVFLALVCSCRAKVYDRCELASILVGSGIPKSQIPDWICLATAESSLDSNAINGNTDGSTDYGIFQINDGYWCSPGPHDICHVACSALQSDDITPSVQCAKTVYEQQGFEAWYGWKNKCQGQDLSSYVSGCSY